MLGLHWYGCAVSVWFYREPKRKPTMVCFKNKQKTPRYPYQQSFRPHSSGHILWAGSDMTLTPVAGQVDFKVGPLCKICDVRNPETG